MTHKFAIQILPIKMLLRDVVWLGIASKLSLLSPYTTLLCYLVTSSFLQQHKMCGKNCKSAEISRISNWTPKQFEQKWHMMTITITIFLKHRQLLHISFLNAPRPFNPNRSLGRLFISFPNFLGLFMPYQHFFRHLVHIPVST